MPAPERLQLHLSLPYKHEVREHHSVRRLLEEGWTIFDIQRVTDHEVLVTFSRAAETPPSGPVALNPPS